MESIMDEAMERRQLLNKARQCQAKFFGHIMRMYELEHSVTIGKVVGRKCRGHQKEKMLDRLAKWLETENVGRLIKAKFIKSA